MSGLVSFLLFAAVFYFMMRFGCGAHMVHGHGGGHSGEHALHRGSHAEHDGPARGSSSKDEGGAR